MTIRLRLDAFDTRVGRRLLAVFLLSAILPILVLSFVASKQVSRQLEAQGRERLETLAKSTGTVVGQRLLITKTQLVARAASLGSGANDAGPLAAPPVGFSSLEVSALAVPHEGIGKAELARLRAGQPVLIASDAASPIMIGVRLPDTTAVLWGVVDQTFLWGLPSEQLTYSETGTLCILGPTFQSLVCSPSGASAPLRNEMGVRRDGTRRLSWMTAAGLQYGGDWDLFLGYEFGHGSWHIVVGEAASVIAEPVAGFTTALYAVVALAVCLVLGLSAWLIRLTLVPLRQLKEATVRLAHHEMGHRVNITSRENDEFHDLAISFNAMASQLEHQMDSLESINTFDRAILSTLHRDAVAGVVLTHGIRRLDCEMLGVALAGTDGHSEEWDFSCQVPGQEIAWRSTVRLKAADLQALRAAPDGHDASGTLLMELTRGVRLDGLTPDTGWVYPILHDGQLMGLLVVGNRAGTAIDESGRRDIRHLVDQASVAITNIRLVEELGLLHRGALEALARTIDAKSPWTAGHSERVTSMSVAIGRQMQLPAGDLELLHRGGLLHDIGKIGIPQEILDKPGRLTDAERAIIETHPVVGARILAPIGTYADVMGIVRHHHERWDGAGYPDKLAGRAIPRLARVLSVADVYDALTSSRPYRAGIPHEKVLGILRADAGTAFDPEVVEAFVAIANEVRLDDPAADTFMEPTTLQVTVAEVLT